MIWFIIKPPWVVNSLTTELSSSPGSFKAFKLDKDRHGYQYVPTRAVGLELLFVISPAKYLLFVPLNICYSRVTNKYLHS